MTTDMMNRRDLMVWARDAGLLREMPVFAAERLRACAVEAVTQVAHGEKDPA
jgi:hypothetical protein